MVTVNGVLEQVVPIVDTFLIALTPERIVSDELKNSIFHNIETILPRISPIERKVVYDYKNRLLTLNPDDLTQKEFLFYENKYSQILHSPDFHKPKYGDHWYTTVTTIVRPIFSLQKLEAKWVLELAGGDFYLLPSTYPQEMHGYHYVGTEISFNALRCGVKRSPNGDFILCDSDELVFAPSSVDVIIIKGALHHQKQKENALNVIFPLLAPHGLIGFTEVATSGYKTNKLKSFIKKTIESDKHTSPLNEFIDHQRTLEICNRYGKILVQKKFFSILRYMLVRFLEKQKVHSLFVSKFICFMDALWYRIPPFRWIRVTSTYGLSIVARKTFNQA